MARGRLRLWGERLERLEHLKKRVESQRYTTFYQKGAVEGLEFALQAKSGAEIGVAINGLVARIMSSDKKTDKETYDREISGFLCALCWALGGEVPEFYERT